MPYWIELHCDARDPQARLARYEHSSCYSFSNTNPAVMVDTYLIGKGAVLDRAKGAGWKKTRGPFMAN